MMIDIKEVANKLKRIGAMHAVGDVWIGFNDYVPAGVLLCNGGTYSKKTYADLWEWVKNTRQYKSSSEYERLKNSNGGQCPYFCDYDSNNFKTPVLTAYPSFGTPTSSNFYKRAGLPNITGTLVGANPKRVAPTGFVSEKGRVSVALKGASDDDWGAEYSLDASRSNSAYGRSTTVTPETNIIQIGVYAVGAVSNIGKLSLSESLDALKKATTALEENKAELERAKGNSNLITKTGSRGKLSGYSLSENVTSNVGDYRVDKNSPDTIVLTNLSTPFSLTFISAPTAETSVKTIVLKATQLTVLRVSGARWVDNEPPDWGKPNSVLTIIAHFRLGEVVLSVFENKS